LKLWFFIYKTPLLFNNILDFFAYVLLTQYALDKFIIQYTDYSVYYYCDKNGKIMTSAKMNLLEIAAYREISFT